MNLPAFTEPWPAGVTHRYVTVAGATVDIKGRGPDTSYRCTGCPAASYGRSEFLAHEAAQKHAETCRALPRPNGGTR
jgi:hypothetical protein